MEQMEQLKELYKKSFSDSEEYVDWFFRHKAREDHVVSLSTNAGEIVSALHLVERRIVLSGRSFRCPFVVAAATMPEYRGQGNFEKVMLSALYGLNEQGIVLTELFPVNHKYYLKYGFATVGKLRQHRVPPRKASADGSAFYARACAPGDEELLFWLYHRFTAACDGYADRSREDFTALREELAVDGGRAFLIFERGQGAPSGYFFEEEDGNVPELVMEDFGRLYDVPELAGKLVTLPHWVEKGRELPGNQARIVNVKKLLSLCRFDPSVCEAVRIRVRDRVLCHNNVTLSLVIAQGMPLVGECGEFDYELTVEELTSLVFGAFALYRTELPPKLCEIFGKKNNICFEKF